MNAFVCYFVNAFIFIAEILAIFLKLLLFVSLIVDCLLFRQLYLILFDKIKMNFTTKAFLLFI